MPDESTDAWRNPGRILAVATVTACAVGAGWLLTRLARFEYGLDQGIYAVVADVMVSAGGAPYRDAWDFKPPGVFFVFAASRAALGLSMTAVHVLEAVLWASLVVAFAVFTRRFVESVWPGLLGGAIAVGSHVWLGFWHTTQPESFGAVALAWALVLGTGSATIPGSFVHHTRHAGHVAAGMLVAVAALMKPPLGGAFVVGLALALFRARRTRDPSRRLGETLWTLATWCVGAALPFAALGLYLHHHDALRDFYEALFVFAPEYTRIGFQTGSLLEFAGRSVAILFWRFSWLHPVGLVLLVALPRLAPRQNQGVLLVAGILFFLIAGVALQGRFFAYHYSAALPLLGLLAGIGLWKLTRLGEPFAAGSLALVGILLLLTNANGLRGRVDGGFLERVQTLDDGRSHNVPQRRVAAWVASHTEPGEPIFVWGFQPMLYVLADRPPGSRYVYNAPQRAPWFRLRGRKILMGDLKRTKPAAILVESGDLHPGTAGTNTDSASEVEGFRELAKLLARDYDAGTEVGAFKIHLRRDRPEPAPDAATPPRGKASSRDLGDPAGSP